MDDEKKKKCTHVRHRSHERILTLFNQTDDTMSTNKNRTNKAKVEIMN